MELAQVGSTEQQTGLHCTPLGQADQTSEVAGRRGCC